MFAARKDAAETNSANMIVALWAVPRSVSTAFERMISQRGDFTVFSEPFSVYYYYSDERLSHRYLPASSHSEADWSSILRGIAAEARVGNVFIRDMAYHVTRRAAEAAGLPFVHTFIIRHPLRALSSLHQMLPDFADEETGFEGQYRLAQEVLAATGKPPLIIDGDELRIAPEDTVRTYCEGIGARYLPSALTWEPGMRKEWGRWARWHQDVATSTGFRTERGVTDATPRTLPARVEAVYEKCLRAYEGMVELKIMGSDAL